MFTGMLSSSTRPIVSLSKSNVFRSVSPGFFTPAPVGSKPFAMSTNSMAAYHWIDGAESLDLYQPGGLHPTMPGEILNSRYEIIDKLGYGGYSTFWFALDRRCKTYVAIKIGVSGSSIPRRDVGIMRCLSPRMIAGILDEFEICGPNGTHSCYTTLPTQGSLAEVKINSVFPVRTCPVLAAKMALAVAHVHSRGFVHGDLHLQNFLLNTPLDLDSLSIQQFRNKFEGPHLQPIKLQDGEPLTRHVPSHAVTAIDLLGKRARDFSITDAKGLLLKDFGEAWRPGSEKRLGMESHTPLPRRAPEALSEPQTQLSFASNVWTVATAIWLILGSDFHFSLGELAGEQINSLGCDTLPQRCRAIWECDPIDEHDETPRKSTADVEEGWPPPLPLAWDKNQRYRSEEPVIGKFGEEENQAILELMRGMLCFDPERCSTMETVLESRWLTRWALPELENACL